MKKNIHLQEKAAKLSVFYFNRDLMKYISYIINVLDAWVSICIIIRKKPFKFKPEPCVRLG